MASISHKRKGWRSQTPDLLGEGCVTSVRVPPRRLRGQPVPGAVAPRSRGPNTSCCEGVSLLPCGPLLSQEPLSPHRVSDKRAEALRSLSCPCGQGTQLCEMHWPHVSCSDPGSKGGVHWVGGAVPARRTPVYAHPPGSVGPVALGRPFPTGLRPAVPGAGWLERPLTLRPEPQAFAGGVGAALQPLVASEPWRWKFVPGPSLASAPRPTPGQACFL